LPIYQTWKVSFERGGESCLDRCPSIGQVSARKKSARRRNLYANAKRRTVLSDAHNWFCCLHKTPRFPTLKRVRAWAYMQTLSGTGESAGSQKASSSRTVPGQAVHPSFPPEQTAAIKAVACELPAEYGKPLSRLFVPDIVDIVVQEGIVDTISAATVWRILDADALKPWRVRSWIYPRDPLFYERAAPVLDLYAGEWCGRPLRDGEFVISADEKTSIQARRRLHGAKIVRDGRGQRVEHEYDRKGAWAYLAAWDVHRAKVFGRVEEKTGIKPFGRLTDQVMSQEPYRSARRVFWIVDGGTSHHRSTFPNRLREQYPNAVAVVLPVHASWLNQIEIYFSIVQRKAQTPNDFSGLDEVQDRLYGFGRRFEETAEPFAWRFTCSDLKRLMKRIESKSRGLIGSERGVA